MKIIKTCVIDGKECELAEEHIILELNATGRGFVTVQTDDECVGKPVVFYMGEFDAYYRWFDGIVEREQQADNGYKKLFIREQVAKLEKPLNCALRHITLRELGQWLEQQTGLAICIPQASYADEPIPLFNHSGSGFQLLHNIGRQFQIVNYMWQQAADGSVYIGSHADSRWHGKNVELDESATLTRGSNDMTIPITAAIRPGALINGNKISKVELKGDDYILFWENLDENGKPLQKSAERRQMEKTFPELAGGYHLPKYAKVVGVADPSGGGDISDPFRPKYAVELQLLDEDGNEDKTVPVYSSVPLPVSSTGSQGGDFSFPEVGTMVEVGFAYGRSDKPFVRTMLAQGKTVPSVGVGEQLKQQRPEVFERTDAAGNKTRETDQRITDRSFERYIDTDTEQKQIGQSTVNIDADSSQTIGGNKITQVMGNINEVVAGDKSAGYGGSLVERAEGLAERVSSAKNRIVAPVSYMGSKGQNIFRLLEDTVQLIGDIAKEISNHTHQGPKPDQSGKFNAFANSARNIKGKLTPIIE